MKQLKLFENAHNAQIDEKFHQFNLGNIGNVVYWYEFFKIAAHVPGDIVECGVGRGRSLITISALNFFLEPNEGGGRRILAYDSFEGFPEPSLQDDSPRKPRKGEWSRSPSGKYVYSAEFAKGVLKEAGVPVDEGILTIAKGFFCDTLPGHPDRPIALLHVDGDLYQSYMDCMKNLYPKVASGGLIVFDDFQKEIGKEDFPGARLAVKEYLGEHYKDLRMSVGGTYYLIKSGK